VSWYVTPCILVSKEQSFGLNLPPETSR